jgi:hypothetical protein
VIAVENPLLRRFDLADRTRDELRGTGYFVPVQSLSLGLLAERHEDDYDRSLVGLTAAHDFSVTLSATWTASQDASLQAYATRQVISADQAGSQNGGPADWFAHTADEVNTGGLSGQIKNVKPNLNLGADVYASYTKESINLDVGTPDVRVFRTTRSVTSDCVCSPTTSSAINPRCASTIGTSATGRRTGPSMASRRQRS